ncbi:unnamed protein product, partial [Agarophyton chilense]
MFDPSIMHRALEPTLYDMHVQLDASATELAATFSLPVGYVAAHWLTSRTPVALPAPASRSRRTRGAAAKTTEMEVEAAAIAKQFVVTLCARLHAFLAANADRCVEGAEGADATLRGARPSRAVMERFYDDVEATAAACLAARPPPPSWSAWSGGRARSDSDDADEQQNEPDRFDDDDQRAWVACEEHNDNENDDDDDDDTLRDVDVMDGVMHEYHEEHEDLRRVKRGGMAAAPGTQCAFDAHRTHKHVQLEDDGRQAVKTVDGLYRVAAFKARMMQAGAVYTEMEVAELCRGGVVVGLGHFEDGGGDALDGLLGGTAESGGVGFHSDGWVVRRGVWERYEGGTFGAGDVVSVVALVGRECAGVGAQTGDDEEEVEEVPGSATLSRVSSRESAAAVLKATPGVSPPRSSNGASTRTRTRCSCRVLLAVNGTVGQRVEAPTCLVGAAMAACVYRGGSRVRARCCASQWRFFARVAAGGGGLTLRAAC